MPHVAFVPSTGFRVREAEMRELGMALPGLRQRADAISQLPALAPWTLAAMTPPSWICTYQDEMDDGLALGDELAQERPDLVAISALTEAGFRAVAPSEYLRLRQQRGRAA